MKEKQINQGDWEFEKVNRATDKRIPIVLLFYIAITLTGICLIFINRWAWIIVGAGIIALLIEIIKQKDYFHGGF